MTTNLHSEKLSVQIDRSGQARVVRLLRDGALLDTYSALEAGGHPLERLVDALADEIERLQGINSNLVRSHNTLLISSVRGQLDVIANEVTEAIHAEARALINERFQASRHG